MQKPITTLAMILLASSLGCGGVRPAAEDSQSATAEAPPAASAPSALAEAPPVASAPSATPAAAPSPAAEEAPKPSYRKLEIHSVKWSGGFVIITGATDLPDSADMRVTFDLAGRAPEETYIGVDGKFPVQGGRFEAKLEVPDRPEFAKGPYVAEVLFTPRGQPQAVVDLVGPDGEQLERGKQSYGLSFKSWKVTKTVDNFKVSTSSHSLPDPSRFAAGSPEQLVARVIQAWSRKDWGSMANLTQQSWRARSSNPQEDLQNNFELFIPFGSTDLHAEPGGGEMVTVVAILEGSIGATLHKKQVRINVIRENGTWGFNPVSMLRMTDL